MNKPIFVFFLLLVFGAISGSAQSSVRPANEPYELILQVIAADNSNSKSSIPPNLSETVRRLKTIYGFSDYRLAASMYVRAGGALEYKTVSPELAGANAGGAPAFADWSLRVLGRTAEVQTPKSIEIEGFRFSVRIPVAIPKADEKSDARFVYESIGITSARFSLRENVPTLVSSLATGKPGEMMFLVLTVRSDL